MSIHGICFDNGMSGRCSLDCEAFRDGECDSASEFRDWLEGLDKQECSDIIKENELIELYPDVFDDLITETMDDRVNRIIKFITEEG